MAKIPQYKQGDLASALVGTPGVDRSASMVSNELLQDTGQLASAALSSEDQQNRLMAQHVKESMNDTAYQLAMAKAAQVAQQKVHDQLLRETQTADYLGQSERDLIATYAKLKNDNKLTPELLPQKLNEWQTQYATDFRSNSPMDEKVAADWMKGFTSRVNDFMGRAYDFKYTQGAENALANRKAYGAQAVDMAGKVPGDFDSMGIILKSLYSTEQTASFNATSPGGVGKVEQDKIAAASVKAFYESMMQEAPNVVLNGLQSKRFTEYITPDTQNELARQAHSSIAAIEQRANEDAALTRGRQELGVVALTIEANSVRGNAPALDGYIRKIKALSDAELAKPKDQQDLLYLKMLNSASNEVSKDKENAIIQGRALAAQERIAVATERGNINWEYIQKQRAKAETEEKRINEVYNSKDNIQRRVNGQAAIDLIKNKDDPSPQELLNAYRVVMDGYNNGAYTTTKGKDDALTYRIGWLDAAMQHALGNADMPWWGLVGGAPQVVYDAINPTNDVKIKSAIDTQYTSILGKGEEMFRQQHGRPPQTDDEKTNLRNMAARKLMFNWMTK